MFVYRDTAAFTGRGTVLHKYEDQEPPAQGAVASSAAEAAAFVATHGNTEP